MTQSISESHYVFYENLEYGNKVLWDQNDYFGVTVNVKNDPNSVSLLWLYHI